MRWSLTKLKISEQCGAKLKFRYVDRIPEKKTFATQRGTDQHSVIEGFLKSELSTLPSELDFYTGFLLAIKQTEFYPEIKLGVKEDLTSCDFNDKDVWLQAVLDLVVIQPETIHNYDWKSGKIYDDHDDQKEIYSMALMSKYPSVSTVQSYHVYTDLNQTRRKEYSRNDVSALWTKWTPRVREMERKLNDPLGLVPNPGWHCRWCAYSRSQGGPCQF